MLLKPFSSNDRKLYGPDKSSSFYSDHSQDNELLLPKRVVLKDAITAGKVVRGACPPIQLGPILSQLPSAEARPSPFSEVNASSGEFLTSSPPRSSSFRAIASSAPSLSDSLSFTFVISNSEDSLKAKTPVLPQNSAPLQGQSSPPSLGALSPSRFRSGSIPPRSSSLKTVVTAEPQNPHTAEPLTSEANLFSREEQAQNVAPVYADVILPNYLRDSVKSAYTAQASLRAEVLKKADEEYEHVPAIKMLDPEKAEPHPQIESLLVRETVLARASSYTRGLVGGSSPNPSKAAGTELQFEIVKGMNQF